MLFDAAVFVVAVSAGGVAAITGFGIGSLLTPLLAWALDTRLAVAVVSIPHFIGTAVRYAMGAQPERRVLWRFGMASAAGGLLGALLNTAAANPWLTMVFGALLMFTALGEWRGWSQRMRFTGPLAWMAGAVSGFLGGLVGNQGGIRSAALLGFNLQRDTFVATATAIGLMVDAARMPLYIWTQHDALIDQVTVIAIACAGVVVGTVLGRRLLVRLPETRFRLVVAVVVGILGALMLTRGIVDARAAC